MCSIQPPRSTYRTGHSCGIEQLYAFRKEWEEHGVNRGPAAPIGDQSCMNISHVLPLTLLQHHIKPMAGLDLKLQF